MAATFLLAGCLVGGVEGGDGRRSGIGDAGMKGWSPPPAPAALKCGWCGVVGGVQSQWGLDGPVCYAGRRNGPPGLGIGPSSGLRTIAKDCERLRKIATSGDDGRRRACPRT
ncbi:hypothetical protein BZA05DRAFT_398595 [Tricharina praecox]|uniref:uncharacterized protein n=1 Tax=Tricharina praecox TaxID=43433 RepID=UPI0022206D31|nr:uncharacterized protein BZA05DRAFT_398595 [Tricharina praecox]KAI5851994.1 hypothetical protein BZA05DRAFT_398595 [Tricharina praecox]